MPPKPTSADLLLRAAPITCVRERRTIVALDELVLAAGDLLELRGANGSGKTTLLRALAGLFPCEGEVNRAARLAFVGHRNGNSGLLTALENLRWHQTLSSEKSDTGQALDALDRVGLLRSANKPVQHLSQGQQRRLALARLVLCDARVWLLDEPHAALDVSGQILLDELLVAHRREGGAALVSSHTPLSIATRVIDLSVAVVSGVAA